MFNSLIGNEDIKEILINIINSDKIPNTLLFEGEEGIGKFSFAMEFSRAILCLDNLNTSPDFRLIQTEDKIIKVAHLEGLIDFISKKSTNSNKKVIIIDQAHKMNLDVQNKLLKTFEESNSSLVIILISSETSIIDTVLSRCFRLRFNKLSEPEMECFLRRRIEDNHKVKELIKRSNGIPLKALKIISNDEYDPINSSIKIFSLLSSREVSNAIYRFSKYPEEVLFEILSQMAKDTRDMYIFLNMNSFEIIENKIAVDEISYLANKIGEVKLIKIASIINRTIAMIKANANLRVVFNFTLMKLQEEIDGSSRN
jgi:DNA polymerase-3 subunit delta'